MAWPPCNCPFLGPAAEEPPGTEQRTPIFVTRDRELARLDGFLNQALRGQGRVAFVIGDAGQGKTALLQEFARRAQAAHPELVVAGGNGSAYTGQGDPYLPFREMLGQLTGDIEDRCATGSIDREQARRLWHTLPLTVQVLVEAGPDWWALSYPLRLSRSGPNAIRRGPAGRNGCPGCRRWHSANGPTFPA